MIKFLKWFTREQKLLTYSWVWVTATFLGIAIFKGTGNMWIGPTITVVVWTSACLILGLTLYKKNNYGNKQ